MITDDCLRLISPIAIYVNCPNPIDHKIKLNCGDIPYAEPIDYTDTHVEYFIISGLNPHLVLTIGEREYTLEIANKPMRDVSGQPDPTKIDWNAYKLILSPDCTGRTAVSAALGMFLAACKNELGSKNYPYTDLDAITLQIERFLLDVENAQEVIRTRAAHRSKQLRRSATLIGAAAAIVGITFCGYISTPSRQQAAIPIQAIVGHGLPDPTEGLNLYRVDLNSPLLVSAHPDEPEFITASPQGTITRLGLHGDRQVLGHTIHPARSIFIDSTRQRVIASDWAEMLHILPFDLHQPSEIYPFGVNANRVFPVDSSTFLWVDSLQNVSRLVLGADGLSTSSKIDDAQLAISSKSGAGAYAIINNGFVTVRFTNQQPDIHHPASAGQHLNALDSSKDLAFTVLAFDDGTINTFQRSGKGYRSTQLKLPDQDRAKHISLTSDGRYAYAVGEKLYCIDLQANRVSAQLDLSEVTDEPIVAIAVQNNGQRLVLATLQEGLVWQP